MAFVHLKENERRQAHGTRKCMNTGRNVHQRLFEDDHTAATEREVCQLSAKEHPQIISRHFPATEEKRLKINALP